MPEDVREKLWNFAYDLLEEGERKSLRDEISSNPQIAREYSRVMLEINLVRQAAKSTNYTLDFVPPEDYVNIPPHEPARPKDSRWRFAGRLFLTILAGSLAMALVMIMSTTYWSPDSPVRPMAVTETWENFAHEFPRMLVTGPGELNPGVAASYQVIVQRVDGEPITTRLSAMLKDDHGMMVWREFGNTNAGGDWRFKLPSDLSPGHFQLLIDTPELGPRTLPAELQLPRACSAWLTAKALPESFWNTAVRFTSADYDVKLNRRLSLRPAKPPEAAQLANQSVALIPESLAAYSSHVATAPVFATVEVFPQPTSLGVDLASTRLGELDSEANNMDRFNDAQNNDSLNYRNSGPSKSVLDWNFSGRYKRWFVEGLSFENGIVRNRFLVPTISLHHQLKMQSQATLDTKSDLNLRTAALFDYSTAPPQSIAPMPTSLALPLLGKLDVTASFNRTAYQAGDLVELKIQVADENDQPNPALLGVTVESLPPTEAQTRIDEAGDKVPGMFTTAGQPALEQPPLVFDNCLEQMRNLELAFSTWRGERNARRQYVSLLLLFGSGIGYALILFGSLLKLLPRPWIWLPIVGVLFTSFTVGAIWIPISDPPGPQVQVSPLMNYGVRTEPPFDAEFLAQDTRSLGESWAESKPSAATEGALSVSNSITPSSAASLAKTNAPLVEEHHAPIDFSLPELPAMEQSTPEQETALSAAPVLLPPVHFWVHASRQLSPAAETNKADEPQLAISSTLDLDTNRIANNHWRSYIHREDSEQKHAALGLDESAFFSNAEFTLAELSRWSDLDASDDVAKHAAPTAATGVQYWHPLINTDANGMATITFMVPPGNNAMLIRIDAHHADRVGVLRMIVPMTK